MTLTEFATQEAKNAELKATVRRLLQQLEKAKNSKEELTQAVYMAIRDGVAGLDIPPVPAPPKNKKKHGEEVAVAVLADWQLAKVTPDYNTKACERRIELLADKILYLTDIQRHDHPVRKLRVWALGDIIEGELIFPGQSFLIDASLYQQITIDGPRIMGNFLRKMLSYFDEVEFVGVIGNHGALGGRSRRDYSPETNADRILYKFLEQLFEKEKRIKFHIPEGAGERNWYAVDDIDGYKTLLFHGDQIKGGFGGFPWYGFGRKLQGWKNGAIPEGFDDAFCGHFHTPTRMTLNSITCRVSGSPESYNTYAQEMLAAVGRPSQPLLFVKPGWGVTTEYTVYLDEEIK